MQTFVHWSLSMVPKSERNEPNPHPSTPFSNHFNNVLPSTLGSSNWKNLQIFQPHIYTHFSALPPPPSSAEVLERVQLYLYSP